MKRLYAYHQFLGCENGLPFSWHHANGTFKIIAASLEQLNQTNDFSVEAYFTFLYIYF